MSFGLQLIQSYETDENFEEENDREYSCPQDPELADKESLRVSMGEDVDSDGSFFADPVDPVTGIRKRRKKEVQRLLTAKKRRSLHRVKLQRCGCLKQCSKKFAKDERINENLKYWNLDAAGQTGFIRERVHRIAIERRMNNRHTKGKFKIHRYQFNMMRSDGEFLRVCRKFFLNTIGFNETCGYVCCNILHMCLFTHNYLNEFIAILYTAALPVIITINQEQANGANIFVVLRNTMQLRLIL